MDIRVKLFYDESQAQMDKAIVHTENELNKLRAGKALPSMLDSVFVDYYGNPTALSQVANINTPDARTILVQPWEKPLIATIEKAIIEANLGFNPQNDGSMIRINIPPLTEERRKDLVKKAKAEAEQGKITVRNLRKDVNEKIKRLSKDGLSEDEIKIGEGEVQKLTDSFMVRIDKIMEIKEKEILTI